jgi:arsenate reductase (thioredoxin)
MPLLSLAAALGAQAPHDKPRKMVFVCEHGTAKSVLAAAEFQQIATQKGLKVEAIARGTNIDATLSPNVVKGLVADGLEPGLAKPIKVTSSQDLADALRIVTFSPDLTALTPRGAAILDWSAAPSPGKDYAASRDFMRRSLETSAASLANESKSRKR